MLEPVFIKPITALKQHYQTRLGFLGRLFFPRQLKKALENPSSTCLDILHTAFASTYFFHKTIDKKGLGVFFNDPLIQANAWLFEPSCLTKEQRIDHANYLNTLVDPNVHHAIADATKYYHSLSAFQRFFFPARLKQALTNSNKLLPLQLIQLVEQHAGFFARLFFPSLFRRFFNNTAVQLAQNLISEHTLPAGTQRVARNLDTLKNIKDGDQIISLLTLMNSPIHQRKAQRNFDAIRTHRHQAEVVAALRVIHSAAPSQSNDQAQNLQKSFNQVIKSLDSATTVKCLTHLREWGLLNQSTASDNLKRLFAKHELGWTEQSLSLLRQHHLFDVFSSKQTAFEQILAHQQSYELYLALSLLAANKQLTAEHFNRVVTTRNPDSRAKSLIQHSTNASAPTPLFPPLASSTPEESNTARNAVPIHPPR